jgi:hypothetical protein
VDLATKTTLKEVVDGQQRSHAILEFFDDDLRISTQHSPYHGQRFEDLGDDLRRAFLEYSLSTDLIIDAEPEEIREIFTRFNSYTAPLNYEEQRHARYQGALKWFIVGLIKQHAATLRKIGVFTDRDLSRMLDARFFTEILLALEIGMQTYSHSGLDDYYRSHDKEYEAEDEMEEKISATLDAILGMQAVELPHLAKPATFYTLFLACWHFLFPVDAFQTVFRVKAPGIPDLEKADAGLSWIGSLLDQGEEDIEAEYSHLSEKKRRELLSFVRACRAGTNTKLNRAIRLKWFCRALGGMSLP